jgi:integrase
MPCVRKRRGKWVADYRDAFGVRRTPGFRTKAEADNALAEGVTGARQAMQPAVDPDILVQAYAKRWLGQIAATLKTSSVDGYEQRLRVHILPLFGRDKVRELDRGRIKAFLASKLTSADKAADGLSRESVRLIHATIRAMLYAAIDDGVLQSNPASRLGKALRLGRSKATRQEEIRAFDRAQIAAFLGATAETDAAMYPLFLTMARTGLRIGEAMALQWADFDFAAREIRVTRGVSNTGEIDTPKSGHGRTVDMSMSVKDTLQRHHARLLERWLKRKPQVDKHGQPLPKGDMPSWVFPSVMWTPMDHSNVGKRFKRVVKAAGLPPYHSPHDLRHTFASLLLQQGESPVYIQRQLGHASIQLTVDTYGRWLPMGNKAAVDKLDGVSDVAEEAVAATSGAASQPNGSKVVANEPALVSGSLQVIEEFGDPGRARTFNPEIKSLLLYH